jgi:hypothetical protein
MKIARRITVSRIDIDDGPARQFEHEINFALSGTSGFFHKLPVHDFGSTVPWDPKPGELRWAPELPKMPCFPNSRSRNSISADARVSMPYRMPERNGFHLRQ